MIVRSGLPICIRVLLSDCSVLYEPLPSRFLEFFGRAGAIVGEVPSLDGGTVVQIDVIAMEALADNLASFGFGASAFATGTLVPPLDERRVGLGSHRFRNTARGWQITERTQLVHSRQNQMPTQLHVLLRGTCWWRALSLRRKASQPCPQAPNYGTNPTAAQPGEPDAGTAPRSFLGRKTSLADLVSKSAGLPPR